MKKLILIFGWCFIVWPMAVSGQTSPNKNAWETLLNDVKIKYVYSIKYGTYLPKPKFGKDLVQLEGKEITLKGFFLPVDITGNIKVISYKPMEMCFFCTGSGIETIIEINTNEDYDYRFKRLKTDDYILIKGVLTLNKDDYEHLVYVLNNVELVKVIK
ncbi:hypothetical protein [Saccharicrinis fermentans]|uniref:DUF3299 domain-containing protein n=1 Tax=Saccharicrinis fermentans DSM 9555 = JCM 21142 TaxID=869213 RepID=W7Y633_9BACT|nr:hypothetical protein [Saccharicrinis fermentans]GAF03607.1 hypothetical protein JCM21142_52285 [Saccharicrinis fermentans DSM 9555 = JCM 21142]